MVQPTGFDLSVFSLVAMPDEYAQGDPYQVEYNLQEDFHQRRLELTLELLSAAIADRSLKAKILDVGCGEGHLTAAFKRSYPQTEVTALDCSLYAIHKAQTSCRDIDFLVC